MQFIKPTAGAPAQQNETPITRPRGQLVLWSDIVANRPSTHPGFVSTRVLGITELAENILGITELAENILGNLDLRKLMRIQPTCQTFDALIRTSPSLKPNLLQQKPADAIEEIRWVYDHDSESIWSHKTSSGAEKEELPFEPYNSMLVHRVNPLFFEPSDDGYECQIGHDVDRKLFNRLAHGHGHGLYADLHKDLLIRNEMEKIAKSPSARLMQLAWPPVKRVIVEVERMRTARYEGHRESTRIDSEEIKAESGVTIGDVFDAALRLTHGHGSGTEWPDHVCRSIQFPDGFLTEEGWIHRVEEDTEKGIRFNSDDFRRREREADIRRYQAEEEDRAKQAREQAEMELLRLFASWVY